MKKTLFIVLCSILSIPHLYSINREPFWVTQMPPALDTYVGIASAPLTNPDYRNMARLSALNDIASQISVNVESNSFMQSVDIDGEVRELFDLRIKESLSAYLGGHELIDSYQSDTHYYVYYRLDKDVYEAYIEAKRSEIVQIGLDYLAKGRAEEQNGNLLMALSLYAKGMSDVEPYLNLSLNGEYEGRYVNVATELYAAYKGIFTEMIITSNVTQISAKPLAAIREPIAVCLSKNGVVIPNMMLCASFSSGEGVVSSPSKTDYTGTAIFYLTNVISKDDVQSVSITIDDSILGDLPTSYRSLIANSEWPEQKVMITVDDTTHTAYFDVENNDVAACERQVRSIFANNYFEINDDPMSDLYILYSTTFSVGNEVDGEMYKFNECFCSLSVRIYNNHTHSLLGEYATSEIRVLVPANKSEEQAMQMCTRELMKKYKVGLPVVLKKIKL